MAREYKVLSPKAGGILRVYDQTGLSWRDAKKQLRQFHLDMAHAVRGLREKDAVKPTEEVLNEQELGEVLGR